MPAASSIPTTFAEPRIWVHRLAYAWRRALGRCLVSIPLHRWSSPSDLPPGWRRKSRVRWCEFLLPLGNLYLRLQGAPSEVLPARRWLERETVIAATLGRDVQSRPSLRALDMRLIPGVCLREILRGTSSLDVKLEALRRAAAALRQLHAISICEADGHRRELSHGDATCNNVIVDPVARRAAWIDFDTRHRAHLSTPDRHADDLRTLLFSGAACLPEQADSDCAESVFAGYGDEAVVQQVRRCLLRQRCPAVFHVAQAPLSFARFHKLRRLVVFRSARSDAGNGFNCQSASHLDHVCVISPNELDDLL
jgi:tRNA A-37 threonylcarbamoyl transferase component Bud32